MRKIYVIVVAGGSSSRMDGIDKLLVDIAGMSVIEKTISSFLANDIYGIILVSSNEKIIEKAKLFEKVVGIAPAGDTRSESVKNGLRFVEDGSYVMIHDGARPFLSNDTLDKCIAEAKEGNAFVVGVYSKDTVKYVEDGYVSNTIDRSKVFLAHTPQGFLTDDIKKAYEMGYTGTDDSFVFESFGGKVKAIEGNATNIKITTREDLRYL